MAKSQSESNLLQIEKHLRSLKNGSLSNGVYGAHVIAVIWLKS